MDLSIAYFLSSSAGADADVTLYTVTKGKILTVKKVEINFDADTSYDLKLHFKEGDTKKLPDQGLYQGNSQKVTVTAQKQWGSGSNLVLHHKNTAAATKSAFISIDASED